MTILLLHGFMGDENKFFLPFLRDHFSPRHKVICPSLPSPTEPTYREWSDEVSKLIEGESVDATICHSLGGTLALNMISEGRLSTRMLVTVGSSHGPKDEDVMNNFLEPPILVSRVKENLEKFYAVSSFDDPWTHHEFSSLLVKQAGAVGLFYSTWGHFETENLPDDLMTLMDSFLQS